MEGTTRVVNDLDVIPMVPPHTAARQYQHFASEVILRAGPDYVYLDEHDADLDEEFSVSSDISDFEAYLNLEDRLFRQLETEVLAKTPKSAKTALNRYHKGSRVDPTSWQTNWNRTFELPLAKPKVGVLLLHGMSDSPYSLRRIAKDFHAGGAHVLGLRIPGHGTAPSGLRRTTFEDMAAAVELAMAHLESKLGDVPIVIVGYSNGGALAVHYTAGAIAEKTLPIPAGLILFSPEIGISPAAPLASVQAWFGEVLGLDRLAWTGILPEYDPYKYASFAVNAGVQAYRATQLVRSRLVDLETAGRIGEMPPILAFQSAADSTVIARALVTDLFDKLQPGGHEIVIFDVNRMFETEGLLAKSFDFGNLLTGENKAFTVSMVTNVNPRAPAVELRTRAAGETEVVKRDLGLTWPAKVYSLAHIALPFDRDDPVYGAGKAAAKQMDEPNLQLGSLAVHGENNTLAIPISALTRQHWNPFYDLVEEKRRGFAAPLE
ncbi:MAG: alpha/beta fold hydrolase [Paracoccaceae bacterium]